MKLESILSNMNSKVVSELEAGRIPWKKNRNTLQIDGLTGSSFTWINQLVLQIAASNKKFTTNRRLTYSMIHQLWGSIKNGESGTSVIFKDILEYNNYHEKKMPVLCIDTVFNLDQTTLKPSVTQDLEVFKWITVGQIIENFADKPVVVYDKFEQAYYRLDIDEVHMPFPADFDSLEEYFSTLFHEFSHATWAPHRLHRFEKETRFKPGDQFYGFEELVAATSEAYLCLHTQMETTVVKNTAAYIEYWLKISKNDPNIFFFASNKWREASEYIMRK